MFTSKRKIAAFFLAAAMLCTLCACSKSKTDSASMYLKSKGYEVTMESDSDYPCFSAKDSSGLPNLSYVECKDEEDALMLFENDKEVIENGYSEVNTGNGEDSTYAFGEADGVVCKTIVCGNVVVFINYESGDDDTVNDLLRGMGIK